jgi:hypothetical protein
VESNEPVGVAEIAELLGVPGNTVTSWRQRGQLPAPRWHLRSGPLWLASEISAWYEQVKSTSAVAVVPDRISQAIDLTAEPARAEVYAHYGLAMGMAQMVEHELATVVVLLGHLPPERDDFLKEIEEGNKKTLGQLKDQLIKIGAPVLGISHLQRVVKTRNLVAHTFFRDAERSVKMNTERGRAELIAELDDAAREFFVTSQHLRSIQVRLAVQRGISKNTVIQRIQELRSGKTPETKLGRAAAILAKGSPQAIETIEEEFAKAENRPPNRRGTRTR